MSDGHGKSQLLLVREAATSPVLLVVIFGIASVVQLGADLISGIDALDPVYKDFLLIEPVIRYVELTLFILFIVTQAFSVALVFVAAGSEKYHKTISAMRAERHERRKKQLEHDQEIERLRANYEGRRLINQCLAPEQKFPLRVDADAMGNSHVVSINRAQRSDRSE